MATKSKPKQTGRRAEDPEYIDILGKIKMLNDEINTIVMLDPESRKKIDSMYKILVTGNGTPPLPETVRNHDKWISEQKDEAKERKKQGNQIFVMGIGQIFGLVALAVSIWIGLR